MATKKRAAAGSGTIFPWKRRVKDPDTGKESIVQVGWTAMLDLGIIDGKRRRKPFYGRTQRDVRERLNEALRDHQRGVLPRAGRMTVEQFLRQWLVTSETRVRPRTMEHYRWLVHKHLIPSIGRRQLEKLTPSDVEALLASKLRADQRKGGLSARSCHHLRSLLRNALNKAVRDGLVVRNAAALSDPLEVPRHELTVLTPLQVQAFMAGAKGDRLEALFLTTLALGLRQGEVMGLRWRDVDLAAGILRVNVALQRQKVAGQLDKVPVLVEPKSATSRRPLLLSEPLRQALAEHRERQLEERRQSPIVSLDQWGLVFTGTYGEPLEGRSLLRAFHELLERAGLPRMRFHDLRHSCASLMLAQKVPAKVVQSILGHSSYHLTMDLYSHVLPSLQEEAAEAQARILGS